MQLYYMLHKIIERGLYTQDDMLQKLDVFYLTNTLTEQEYVALYELVCPPIQDEAVEEEIEEVDPEMELEPTIKEEV